MPYYVNACDNTARCLYRGLKTRNVDTLERHIIDILAEAGPRGLRVGKIVRYVFNASNSMFAPADMSEVTRYVRNYVRQNSRRSNSILAGTGKWGVYKLNMRSPSARALLREINGVSDDDSVKPAAGEPADANELTLF